MFKNNTENYGAFSKAIHWLMALLIIMLIAVGYYMAGLPDEDPSRGRIIGMHKAFGALAMMLVVVRIIWHLISPIPPLPPVFTAMEKRAVSSVKGVLYLLMLLVPISGYVMSSAAARTTSFFGLFDLPMLIAENKGIAHAAHETHETLIIVLIASVSLHIAGAIRHRLKDRNGPSDVLNRML